jgi:hypothetical protein
VALVDDGSMLIFGGFTPLAVHKVMCSLVTQETRPPESGLQSGIVVIAVHMLKRFLVNPKGIVTGLDLARGRERRTSIAINYPPIRQLTSVFKLTMGFLLDLCLSESVAQCSAQSLDPLCHILQCPSRAAYSRTGKRLP